MTRLELRHVGGETAKLAAEPLERILRMRRRDTLCLCGDLLSVGILRNQARVMDSTHPANC